MKEVLNSIIHPRLLDRYLFGEFIRIFLGTVVMLTGILVISLVMDNMKYFMNSDVAPVHIALYIVYSLPKLLVNVISPGLMFAVCFVIGQFSSNKELVSTMAAGVSFYRTITPLVIFGFVMWFGVLLLNEVVARSTNTLAQEKFTYIKEGTGGLNNVVYQYHVRGREGFYYVYLYDEKEKVIKGGFNYIRQDLEGLPKFIISAQRAEYDEKSNLWTLKDVEEINFDGELAVSSYNKYMEKQYEFPEKMDYFVKPPKSVEEMNFFELKDEIVLRQNKGVPFYDLEVERHSIFAMPVMSIIVVVIGAIAGSFTKRSAGVASLGITIVVVLLYYVFYSAGRSFGNTGLVPAGIAVWYTPVIFLLAAYGLYKKFNL